ncbi:SDR family oxidoreductase [Sporosarcina sp. FSL K6-1522]|uniref:elongation factor P 5-aminopentanone reductase n=1 Tax=Sporosarcina sp. FSL K6-1522 TaxID=2921554 RepID=UPI00315999A2
MERHYCVVLGASGGIGEAICRSLAASGWSLYLHFHSNQERVAHLQAELTEMFPQSDFQAVQADFTKIDGADELAKQVKHVAAIVVANGQSVVKLLTETTAVEMDALWKVHVQNPVRFISLVSSQLRRVDKSYVVFIGSIWGNTGAAGEVMYSAVKGAQHAFVKAYAKEAAFSGTRVNAIAPGWIDTRMNEAFSPEERQMVIDEIPLMQTGTPIHIAEAVDFLMNGKADYMTGEIMNINGGWSI